jgi:hypothetical protein
LKAGELRVKCFIIDAFVDLAVRVGHHPGGAEMVGMEEVDVVGKTGCAAPIRLGGPVTDNV